METETVKPTAGCVVHMPHWRCMIEETLNNLREVLIPKQIIQICPALMCVCPSAKQKYQTVWKSISDDDMRGAVEYLRDNTDSHDDQTVRSVLRKVLKILEEHLLHDPSENATSVNQPLDVLCDTDSNQATNSRHDTNQSKKDIVYEKQPISFHDIQNKPIRDLPAFYIGLYRVSYILMKALQAEEEWYYTFVSPGERKPIKQELQLKFSVKDINLLKLFVILGNRGQQLKYFGKKHGCRVTLHDIANFEGCHDVDVTIQKRDILKNRHKLGEIKNDFIKYVEELLKNEREQWMEDEGVDDEKMDDEDDKEEQIHPRQSSLYERCTIM